MVEKIYSLLVGKKILILGFGKEGNSTYKLLIQVIPPKLISISDQDSEIVSKLDFRINPGCFVCFGKNYLENINDFDIIIKTPGIPVFLLDHLTDKSKLTSQTELFLKLFADRAIGVTGTKGKSTTASLIKHILVSHYKNDVILVGNIGIPPFDMLNSIGGNTRIVYELSSHQLEHISVSPHIAVILNFYEEHLDHHGNYLKYQLSKLNITRYQTAEDWLVINGDNQNLLELFTQTGLNRKELRFFLNRETDSGAFVNSEGVIVHYYNGAISKFDFRERSFLPGEHNLMNIMAAICVAKIMNIPDDLIRKSVLDFRGLRHRMEYLGNYAGIDFYNDSISTIPQATIQAVRSLKKVDTLILGGKDRGVDYQPLINFLPVSGVRNLIFTGEAGKRILNGLKLVLNQNNQRFFLIESYDEIGEIIKSYHRKGYICLLSPAASSYDQFRNFEERGDVFKKIAESL